MKVSEVIATLSGYPMEMETNVSEIWFREAYSVEGVKMGYMATGYRDPKRKWGRDGYRGQFGEWMFRECVGDDVAVETIRLPDQLILC